MAVITLDQYDEKFGRRNDTIESGGLGPCIAIAIYHPLKRTVRMIHHLNMGTNKPLEAFIKKAIKKIKNVSILEVYVVGGSIANEDYKTNILASRLYSEKILNEFFSDDQIFLTWGIQQI